MKSVTLLFTCLFLINCTPKTSSKKPTWLIGKWKRLNNESTKTTFEFWDKNLSGIGFTLSETDTTFKETLHIINKNDSLFLQVTGVNETPTLFNIIKQTDTSFIATNDTNEFPKIITYWKSKEYLNATVANDDFSIDFVFKKKN